MSKVIAFSVGSRHCVYAQAVGVARYLALAREDVSSYVEGIALVKVGTEQVHAPVYSSSSF